MKDPKSKKAIKKNKRPYIGSIVKIASVGSLPTEASINQTDACPTIPTMVCWTLPTTYGCTC